MEPPPVDLPGEPEADPGLIARSGEVYSEVWGERVVAMFEDRGQQLSLRGGALWLDEREVVELSAESEVSAAARLGANQWLVVVDGALRVLDVEQGTLVSSAVGAYLAQQRVQDIEVVGYESATPQVYIQTSVGLHVWRGEQLDKITPTLNPRDMTRDARDVLWVATSDAVLTLEEVDGELRRRDVLIGQGGDQIVAMRGVVALRQGEALFVRPDERAEWFEVAEVRVALLRGNVLAPDLWWRDVQGGAGHLYGDYMGAAAGVVMDERAVVDDRGRLLTWTKEGAVTRHDRVHRVELLSDSWPGGVIDLPVVVGVAASFPGRVERLEATLDGEEVALAMPSTSGVVSELTVDPAVTGPGSHVLEVRAFFEGVKPPAVASVTFATAATEVTWAGHVEPLFKRQCASCHGVQNVYQLDSSMSWQMARVPQGVSKESFDYILSWVESGNMPPGDLPKLTPAQVTLLRQWRDQGFKP